MNKEISDWQLFQRFLVYVRPHWKNVALGAATVPFSIAATLLLPWFIIRIIDDHVVPGDLDGLMEMVALMTGAVAVGYFSDSIYTFTLQKTGQLAISAMRSDLYAHILSMPRSFFDRSPIGVVLTRLTSDMEALNDSLAIGVLSLFTDFLKTIALLILLITLSWKLTLVVMLILPPIYFVSKFLRLRLRHYYNLTREALANATGYLQECLNGVKTIQLYAAERKVQNQFETKTRHFFKVDKLFRELPEDQDTELASGKYSEQEQAKRLQKFEELRFEDVHFRYTENGPWVLQGVSFKVKKGDRVAIVGATGSGKSTIVRVLNRIYTRYQGSITINGVELSDNSRDSIDAAGVLLIC